MLLKEKTYLHRIDSLRQSLDDTKKQLHAKTSNPAGVGVAESGLVNRFLCAVWSLTHLTIPKWNFVILGRETQSPKNEVRNRPEGAHASKPRSANIVASGSYNVKLIEGNYVADVKAFISGLEFNVVN